MRSFPSLCRALFAACLLALAAGAQAAAQGLIRDTEIEAMVQDWAHPIFRAAGEAPDSIEIFLINDPQLNAFVTPGRDMYFNTGIILESKRPVELKGVIAHETGHIAGRHTVRASDGVRRATLPLIVSMVAGIAAAAAGEGGAAAALISSGQQFATLEFFQYTRERESSADQAALTYLEATGQSGDGLIAFFERFRGLEFRSVETLDRLNPYFRTHPLSSDRIEALRARAQASPYFDTPDSPEDIERLARAQAKIRGFLDQPARTLQEYPETDTAAAAVLARAVARHKLGEETVAHALMDELITREPQNPYFRETKAQLYAERGRWTDAVPHYEAAVALKPEAPLIRLALAEALIEGSPGVGYEDALSHLREAQKVEPRNSLLWDLRSRVHFRRNEMGLYHFARAEAHARFAPQCAKWHAMVALRTLDRGTAAYVRAEDMVVAAGEVLPTCDPRARAQGGRA